MSDTYSEFNTKFDLSDNHGKYLLYSSFTAWICEGSSIAPLLDYAHNKTCQKVVRKEKYFTDSDERLDVDLRRGKRQTGEFKRVNRDNSDLTMTIELKNPATKKIRLCIMGKLK